MLSGILANKMYLYGTRFTVVTDHKPIVPMFNSHSKSMPVRVAKHKSKLRAFDFEVIYEAWGYHTKRLRQQAPTKQ